jgi:hypothetical protein
MKGLLSTAASRAWLGVVAAGVVIVALVLGLQLLPRLGDGQDLVDAAKPVMTDAAVKGETGGADLLAQYVAVLNPLVTKKGHAAGEVRTLVTMIARKTGVSSERARAFLHRDAPHTEALLRALPLSGIADERDRLTQFLAVTLNTTPDAIQDLLAQMFPHLFQTLSVLPSVTDGWYDIPGIEGMSLFSGKHVRAMPGFSRYLRDDLVGTVAAQKDRFQSLQGSGGIGYVPILLLIVGIVAIGFGLVHARWCRGHPSGRFAWGFVVAIGVLLTIVVGALQFFPRLAGAQKLTSELAPAFDAQRVAGTRAGTDLVSQTVQAGDPIVTDGGGASAEVPKLYAYISEQTGLSVDQVRGRLRKAAPRTAALLDAVPLSDAAGEIPQLEADLSHKLGIGGDRLVLTLRRRTPGLAAVLFGLGAVTSGWDQIPGSDGLTRFDDGSPVHSMADFAAYLDDDLVPVFEDQRQHFAKLANTWPPLNVLPEVLLAIGLLLAIYATTMLFVATKPPARA